MSHKNSDECYEGKILKMMNHDNIIKINQVIIHKLLYLD
jgi:hypothetical protein